jgi:hypothetical protein
MNLYDDINLDNDIHKRYGADFSSTLNRMINVRIRPNV